MDGDNYHGPFYQVICVKDINLVEPGNQPPQLRENILTIGVVLELGKLANKQKLKSSKVV
jgi:hypothetical protein